MMFERDYLMRMLSQLIQGIVRSMELRRGEDDPKAAADSLEAVIGQATDIDGSILLGLSPESIADILQVSGTDPGVVEFVARSLLLAADYLDDAGEALLADLRRNQGRALISSFGLVVDEGVRAEDAMEAYVDSMRS